MNKRVNVEFFNDPLTMQDSMGTYRVLNFGEITGWYEGRPVCRFGHLNKLIEIESDGTFHEGVQWNGKKWVWVK